MPLAMKQLYFLVYSGGGRQAAYGQGQMTGKVLAKQTHQPLPYASVAVLGSQTGITSNADGEFVLTMRRLPGKLVVSQLSYGRDTVAVAAVGALPPIELVPTAVSLPTVDMGSYCAKLLMKAYRVLQRTNASKHYGQAFYHQVPRRANDPTEVQEVVWSAKASSAGLKGTITLSQARYAKKETLISHKNLSNFTKTFRLYSPLVNTGQKGRMLRPNSSVCWS
jgi:hypothetical protein